MKMDKKIDNKDVYFIRHNDDDNMNNIYELEKNGLIALFYENISWKKVFNDGLINLEEIEGFTKSRYWQTYKGSLEKLYHLSKNGGYAFVEYNSGRGLKNDKYGYGCVFVEVEKNTNISSSISFEVTLKYKKLEDVSYIDFPVLLAIRPPFSTICIPYRPTFAKIADYLLSGTKEICLDYLHPKMAEQLCVEYLREVSQKNTGKLSYCTLKPGGSTAVIDITGESYIGDISMTIFAQVKNGSIIEDDLDRFQELCEVDADCYGYIFATEEPLKKLNSNVSYIDLNEVFDHFNATKKGRLMLEQMIGFKKERNVKN
jgi:hypothetical protein